MKHADTEKFLLKLPGATLSIQWGSDRVFKVGGKMFAVACTDFTAYPDAPVCSLKAGDDAFADLCEQEGIIPAPYMARAQWVALREWSALSDREIATAVARSYTLVKAGLPKKVQRELDAAVATPARRSRVRR